MTISKSAFTFGRILLASLFVISGIFKIIGFSGTVGFMASLGLPVPTLAVIVTIFVEVGAGLALMSGSRLARPAALLIAIFTVGATLAAHRFWAVDPAAMQGQLTNFLKNLSIIGALLVFWSVKPTE
ncbi:putative membrane protein [Herbaspirillum sp. CF444]|uniref:DoxX family protein n=1 Tax=Herbaspirillum sp. CF444 TaxID=1144319 RepID=UPI0002726EB3|nr:DoxX family protein [Herbaspirillum sp. CF444]EJL86073.1 putative membrane protein [Herbaspirillum sp. CF444]